MSGEIIYSIAAIFSFSAYFLGKMIWLRFLLVLASSFYIISGMRLGMHTMVAWNSAYVIINLFHLINLLINKSSISLPVDFRQIYGGPFAQLSTREFKKLISINDVITSGEAVLLKEGEMTKKLFILLDGSAKVFKGKTQLAELQAGDLIGEMSFISEQVASADVVINEGAKYTYWTHKDLNRLNRKHNAIYTKFISIIGADLVKKIKNRNEQAVSEIL